MGANDNSRVGYDSAPPATAEGSLLVKRQPGPTLKNVYVLLCGPAPGGADLPEGSQWHVVGQNRLQTLPRITLSCWLDFKSRLEKSDEAGSRGSRVGVGKRDAHGPEAEAARQPKTTAAAQRR